MKPRNLLLRNSQSPGDVLMLTAAVRDLHRQHPGKFRTAVATSAGAIWEGNPHVWKSGKDESGSQEVEAPVEEIVCEYPLIHRSNTGPWHFIHAFHQFLGERLGVRIEPTEFRGDIHLSAKEKSWISQVQEISKVAVPFWIVVSGGKLDFTAKWWDPARMQKVVDHFAGRILFVQVGEKGHHHPALSGVMDLRGKTDLRQLIRLMHHAQGVVCPVTFAMHLAAAVEVRGKCEAYPRGMPKNRPCVVIAGGREPAQWEAYPHHQYIHTNGALRCCDNGGCWKSRTVPLGDGDPKDASLCVDVVELATGVRKPGKEWGQGDLETGRKGDAMRDGDVRFLPKCLDMISAEEVIRRVELYFNGGAIDYLTAEQAEAAGGAAG